MTREEAIADFKEEVYKFKRYLEGKKINPLPPSDDEDYKEYIHFCHEIEKDIERDEIALSALSEQKKGGWIPVEERKPKHKQEVFVTYETEDGLKVDKTEYHERHGFAISPTVTAWREDISPYKENDTWT